MKTFKELTEVASSDLSPSSTLQKRTVTHHAVSVRGKGVAQIPKRGKIRKMATDYKKRRGNKTPMKLPEMSERASNILNEVGMAPFFAAGAGASVSQGVLTKMSDLMLKKPKGWVKAMQRLRHSAFPGSQWFVRPGLYGAPGPRALNSLDPGYEYTNPEDLKQ